ncbi:MAG TPA: hypothetical protein VJT72_21070 [Pseudonocardiaceae bacterium]|nr:hypothetical protein [Pseudonocardiaceae bacterium]
MSPTVIGIAALVAWVITALGGFVMLGQWISRGGLRQQRSGATRFPAGLVFSHLGLAAGGLVVWIIYLLTNQIRLAWVAFVLLIPIALLGFIMLARWIPIYQGQAVTAGASRSSTRTGSGPVETEPAERHLSVPVVIAHGLFATATVVLVLLAALGAAGS